MRRVTRSLSAAMVAVALSTPAAAECGFCASEVTLSKFLADCYLKRVDEELDRARASNAEIHLVELAACSTRGASPMPQPRTEREGETELAVDEAFLIPVSAMRCLAEALRAASFDEPGGTLRVEVRDDC